MPSDRIVRLFASFILVGVGMFSGASRAQAVTYLVADTAACNGSADDTADIQALFDGVAPGSEIVFPATPPPVGCRTSAAITVDKALHIRGSGSPSSVMRTDLHPLVLNSSSRFNEGSGAVFWVTSSDVLLEGLELVGRAYGPSTIRNTHGVFVRSDIAGARLHNITIRNLTVTKQRGTGIFVRDTDDFIVEGNHIEDVGYGGIVGEGVRRGWIRNNHVEDIGDPESCEGYSTLCSGREECKAGQNNRCGCQDTPCRNHATYGIVVTGCGDLPCSEDVIISSNTVREVETWVGIMNHGAERVLIFDNDVQDTNFLYANTTRDGPNYPAASSDTAFINNTGDILPPLYGGRYELYPNNPKGEGMWFYSAPGRPADNVMAIANVLRNTGGANFHAGIVAWPTTNARITRNTLQSNKGYFPENGILLHDDQSAGSSDNIVIAHNSIRAADTGIRSEMAGSHLVCTNEIYAPQYGLHIGSGGFWAISNNYIPNSAVPIQGSHTPWSAPAVVPAGVHHVSAAATGKGEVLLQWAHNATEHDSFYIEMRSKAFFSHLVYRPPNLAQWRFDAPTNPHWQAFDPGRTRVTGLTRGVRYQFRLRAHNGAEVSPWSAVVAATVY